MCGKLSGLLMPKLAATPPRGEAGCAPPHRGLSCQPLPRKKSPTLSLICTAVRMCGVQGWDGKSKLAVTPPAAATWRTSPRSRPARLHTCSKCSGRMPRRSEMDRLPCSCPLSKESMTATAAGARQGAAGRGGASAAGRTPGRRGGCARQQLAPAAHQAPRCPPWRPGRQSQRCLGPRTSQASRKTPAAGAGGRSARIPR